ncbi:MAG: hypothetical protein JNL80_00240 [Phycisphaerae bacterium]|nr:hypothetical protein [Phycisphaerae bacterium]
MDRQRLRAAFVEVDRAYAHRGPPRGKQRAFDEPARERMAWRLAMSSRNLVSLPTAAERLGLSVDSLNELVARNGITVYVSRGFVFLNASTVLEELASDRVRFSVRHLTDLYRTPDRRACADVQSRPAPPSPAIPTPFDEAKEWTELDRIAAVRADCLASADVNNDRLALARAGFLNRIATSDALVGLPPRASDIVSPFGMAIWTTILVEGWRSCDAEGSDYIERSAGDGKRASPPAGPWPTALAIFRAEHRQRRRPPSEWRRIAGVPVAKAFYGYKRYIANATKRLGPWELTDDEGRTCVPAHIAEAVYRASLEGWRADREVNEAMRKCEIRGRMEDALSSESIEDATQAILAGSRRIAAAPTAATLLGIGERELHLLRSRRLVPSLVHGPLVFFDLIALRDALADLSRRSEAGLPDALFAPEDLVSRDRAT